MRSKTKEYKEIILPIILKHIPGAKIILYGSRAKHTDKEGSDIDIALDLGCKIDRMKIINITDDLEESILPIHFDIVDLHSVSEDMKEEILKYGVRWK